MAVAVERVVVGRSEVEIEPRVSAGTLPGNATLSGRTVIAFQPFSSQEQNAASLNQAEPFAIVADALVGFGALELGWDGSYAPSVAPVAIATARRLLEAARRTGMLLPAAAPTVNGGVQLEWFADGWELGFEAAADGSYTAYFVNPVSGNEWEGDLAAAPEDVATVLQRFVK